MKIDWYYAVLAAPVITLLLGWVARSIKRLPTDLKEMLRQTANWLKTS
jgi:cytochrome bd-type quinol oxidase subunit 1